jgi:Bacterial regulatory proteins, luxR family
VRSRVERGPSNSQIATTLVISQATVMTHITRLLKLDLRDRAQAVVLAHETRAGTAQQHVAHDTPSGLAAGKLHRTSEKDNGA